MTPTFAIDPIARAHARPDDFAESFRCADGVRFAPNDSVSIRAGSCAGVSPSVDADAGMSPAELR
jgi:hypothetical protein